MDQGSLQWLKYRELGSINNKRLQGSFAYLRQFRFDLMYLSSKKMADVDALSRAMPAGAVAVGKDSVSAQCEVRLWREDIGRVVAPVAQVDKLGHWGFEEREGEFPGLLALQRMDKEGQALRRILQGAK